MPTFASDLAEMRVLAQRVRPQAEQCDDADSARTLDRVADEYEALVLHLDRSCSVG